MTKRIQEVDAYIANSASFAQPILKKIRDLFHRASPDIQEEMKWSFPHFTCDGLVGSMAGFKQHVSFGFWKASLMTDPHGLLQGVGKTSMGQKKLQSLDDLPPDRVMLAYIREAIDLNRRGVKAERPKPKPRGDLTVPDDLTAALKKNKKALQTFEAFSPSHRREYIEWILEAKQEATRIRRVATTVEQLAEGKSRNWKYERKA